VEITPPHGVLSGVVEVMQPITFERGRCHNMTRTGVHVRFNSLSELLDPQQAHVRSDSRNSHFWVLPVEVAGRRVIDLGDRVAFTHGRAPLLLPVSAERYLREQIRRLPEGPKGGAAGELARWLNGGKAKMLAENATQLREMSAYLKQADLARIAEGQRVVVDSTEKELRRAAAQRPEPTPREHAEADLAALSPAQRGAPACIAHDTGMFDATPGCPRGETLVELNPAYFDRSRPGAVQLVVAQTPDGRTHGESEAEFAARRAIWSALDRAALAALVE
jgi:hypothetical protein